MERRYFLGLDLGQRQDHSAIAVVRGAEEPDGAFDYVKWVQPVRTVWEAEELRRLPLGDAVHDGGGAGGAAGAAAGDGGPVHGGGGRDGGGDAGDGDAAAGGDAGAG